MVFWQARFAYDAVRQYSRDLTVTGEVSVASSFPGFSGPHSLTSSFRNGFFLVDHFGKRLVEVDETGHEVAVASTAMLGFGRGLAIDADLRTQRIFLQAENEFIYVLSETFFEAGSLSLVTIDIDPRDPENRLNVKGNRPIAVAVLTTPQCDAATVDSSTVKFGPGGPPMSTGQVYSRMSTRMATSICCCSFGRGTSVWSAAPIPPCSRAERLPRNESPGLVQSKRGDAGSAFLPVALADA